MPLCKHDGPTLIAALLLSAVLSGCAGGPQPAEPIVVDAPEERLTAANEDARADDEDWSGRIEIEPTVVDADDLRQDDDDDDLRQDDDDDDAPTYRDPLIWINRATFAFNDVAYRYALIPAARGYQRAVPQPARDGVRRFFGNLREPISMVNHLLQGRPRLAGRNLARFTVNTTLGLAGLFDPAQSWLELEPARTGFDRTLARYRVGDGPYLVLPLLGPSTLRGTTGAVADYFSHPFFYWGEEPEVTILRGIDGFQEFAPDADSYRRLREQAEDPYVFFRNMHMLGRTRDDAYRRRGWEEYEHGDDPEVGD